MMETDTTQPMTEERFWQETFITALKAGDSIIGANHSANYALRELQKLKELKK